MTEPDPTYEHPVGAGTSMNLIFCAKGSIREALGALNMPNHDAERRLQDAIVELEAAIDARHRELASWENMVNAR